MTMFITGLFGCLIGIVMLVLAWFCLFGYCDSRKAEELTSRLEKMTIAKLHVDEANIILRRNCLKLELELKSRLNESIDPAGGECIQRYEDQCNNRSTNLIVLSKLLINYGKTLEERIKKLHENEKLQQDNLRVVKEKFVLISKQYDENMNLMQEQARRLDSTEKDRNTVIQENFELHKKLNQQLNADMVHDQSGPKFEWCQVAQVNFIVGRTYLFFQSGHGISIAKAIRTEQDSCGVDYYVFSTHSGSSPGYLSLRTNLELASGNILIAGPFSIS